MFLTYCVFCFLKIIFQNGFLQSLVIFLYHIFVSYLYRNLIRDEVELMNTYDYL